jgi:FimV-like protein
MRNSSQAATPSGFVGKAPVRGTLLGAVAWASLLYSGWAAALGMGEITLHSALNQPLNAEIELVETGAMNAEDVVARLAPAEDFARAGVERVFFFNDLRFTPVIRGNRGVIKVTSSKPVTEPYLQFLVQVLRPGGDMLHEYTLLLDPATSDAGRAATRGASSRAAAAQAAEPSRMPVAPPPAVQGKHYEVVGGDTLNSIARRMQGSGPGASASQVADGIKILNPQAFPNGDSTALKVGQSLLLPDAATLPGSSTTPALNSAAPVPPSTEAQRGAEQLAAAAIENQILSKSVEDLRNQLLGLQQSIDAKDKQVIGLQTQLAEQSRTARPAIEASTPVAAAAPDVAPAAPVVATPIAQEESPISTLLLGAVVILLLLLVLAWSVRRNRLKQALAHPVSADTALIKPARGQGTVAAEQAPVVSTPVAAPPVSAPSAPPRPIAPRPAAGSNDALDGVSIYVAYGRFAEALGILRDALVRQPERTDIRVRILELLAEQGDAAGFAQEQLGAREHGIDAQQVEEIRSRYPQLKRAESEQAASAASTASAAATAALAMPLSAVASPAMLTADEPAQLDESAAASLNPEPADEFQLNLDDLSMDADWDLVDPFEKPQVVRAAPTVAPAVAEETGFASNLTELPDVEEIADERYLSDFPEEQMIVESNNDALDDAFLDGFMDDAGEFDLLDLDEEPLSKINQAQVFIDDGDVDAARALLLEVIEESDEEHQQTARDLLAGL